jgi:hypothetical protein
MQSQAKEMENKHEKHSPFVYFITLSRYLVPPDESSLPRHHLLLLDTHIFHIYASTVFMLEQDEGLYSSARQVTVLASLATA